MIFISYRIGDEDALVDRICQAHGDKFDPIEIPRVPILLQIGEYVRYRSKADDLSLLGFIVSQSWLGSFSLWLNGAKSKGRR